VCRRDALACNPAIASTIAERGDDHLLAVKTRRAVVGRLVDDATIKLLLRVRPAVEDAVTRMGCCQDAVRRHVVRVVSCVGSAALYF
jgi:hypothetical protein